MMRTLAVVVALLAFLTSSVDAQMGGGRRHRGDDSAKQDQKPKVDEKAYKEALKRIPDPKEKYDPWSGARPATPDQKQGK